MTFKNLHFKSRLHILILSCVMLFSGINESLFAQALPTLPFNYDFSGALSTNSYANSGITLSQGTLYTCSVGNSVGLAQSNTAYFTTKTYSVGQGKGISISFKLRNGGTFQKPDVYLRVNNATTFSYLNPTYNSWVLIGSATSSSTSSCVTNTVTAPSDIVGGQRISVVIHFKNSSSSNWVAIDDLSITEVTGSTVPTTYTENFTTNKWYKDAGYVQIPYHSYVSASNGYTYLFSGGTGGSFDYYAAFYTGYDPDNTNIITREINTSGYSKGELRYSFRSRYTCAGPNSYTSDEVYSLYAPKAYIMSGLDNGTNTWTQLPVNSYFPDATWRYVAYDISAYKNTSVKIKLMRGGSCTTYLEGVDNIKVLDRDCSISSLSCGTITGASSISPNTDYTYSVPAVTGATYYKWYVRNGGTLYDASPYVKSGQGTQSATINFGSLAEPLRVICIPYDANPGSNTDACYAKLGYQTITIAASCSDPVFTVNSPEICNGSSTSLSVNCTSNCSGVTYSWAPTTGLSATSGTSVTANPTSTTTYTVTGVNGSCSSTATSVVTVKSAPSVSITPGGSTTICSGEGVTLNASGASTYSWNPSASLSSGYGASVVATPTAAITTVTTTYTVTGTGANGCTNTATIMITTKPLPPLEVNPPSAVCTGQTSVTLTASGAVSYVWSPTDYLTPSSGTSATETAQISQLTFYTVTGTGANGCTTNMVVPVATVAVGGTASPRFSVICSGDSKLLTVTGAAGNAYQWQSSANELTGWTDIPGQTNTSYTASPVAKTYYRLMAQSNSCWNVASTTAVVDISSSPITVSVTGRAANSISLNWTPVGSGNYTVIYDGTSAGSHITVTPPYTLSGLVSGGTYNITVTQTGLSCPASGDTSGVPTLCAMPTNVSVSSAGNKKLKVDWEGAAGNYRVYYRPTFVQNAYLTKDVTTTGTSGTTTINVLYNTSYEAYVVSKDCPSSGVYGQSSALSYGIVGSSSPCTPAPTINYVKSTCAGQIEVSMSGSPTGKYTVAVQRMTPTVSSMYRYTVTGSYFQVNVNSAGETFLVAVASNCVSGTSDYVVYPGGITIKPLCKAVSNLVLSHPTCYGFTASWNRDECLENTVNNYQMFIKKSGALTWNSYQVVNPNAPITPYKLVNWLGMGYNMSCYVRSNYICNGYMIQGPPSTVEQITTLSSGCRAEDESLIQPEEPAAVITSADNTEAISLYPNPNGGQFRIDISRLSNEKAEVRIEVINMLGQTILTRISEAKDGFGNELITLPETVSSGTYFVRVTVGNNLYTTKVNVSR